MYFFPQITTFIKVRSAFVFGLQTLLLKDFSRIHQSKGLKPKNNGQTHFYECCDLTKKVYLTYLWCNISDELWHLQEVPNLILQCHTQCRPTSTSINLHKVVAAVIVFLLQLVHAIQYRMSQNCWQNECTFSPTLSLVFPEQD